jgi:hypothetical protein
MFPPQAPFNLWAATSYIASKEGIENPRYQAMRLIKLEKEYKTEGKHLHLASLDVPEGSLTQSRPRTSFSRDDHKRGQREARSMHNMVYLCR